MGSSSYPPMDKQLKSSGSSYAEASPTFRLQVPKPTAVKKKKLTTTATLSGKR